MPDHQILAADTHGDVRVHIDAAADRGDAVMSCLTVPAEFRQVQQHYPILFRQNAERTAFTALAMFGFVEGENLFLGADGSEARYRPLAMAIQPFLIGPAAAGSDTKQVHVDMASARIAGTEGVRLFDDVGRPTPYLDAVAERLGALDEGYLAAPAFFAALARHELLEPLTLEITLDDGSVNRLVGFHVIDEDRLRLLDAGAIADLHGAGHLMPIFMAIASLGQLGELVARKNRAQHG